MICIIWSIFFWRWRPFIYTTTTSKDHENCRYIAPGPANKQSLYAIAPASVSPCRFCIISERDEANIKQWLYLEWNWNLSIPWATLWWSRLGIYFYSIWILLDASYRYRSLKRILWWYIRWHCIICYSQVIHISMGRLLWV